MSEAVVRYAGLALVHTPDILIRNGAVQVAVRQQDPESDYLKNLPKNLRKFSDVVGYPPNQSYIGNIDPRKLDGTPRPWYQNNLESKRFGKHGEVMPQEDFYLLLKYVDTFDLVQLTPKFIAENKDNFADHPVLKGLDCNLGEGADPAEIESMVANHTAEGLYQDGVLVGAVKQAHDSDETLNAHVIHENLCTKASSVLAAFWMAANSGVSMDEVDYIIECSEEACGDINQRGGGNFAKAIGEKVGCGNATGSDLRGFCAAPAHAMISAAALVKSGIYKNVLVVAGGAVAKLGMNGRDHVKKEMPVLEDCLGAFAFLVSENDGVSPVIKTDFIGRHTIKTGSSPQAVMGSLISEPLEKNGWKIPDVELFSVEMQNPEITKPAGAGDVPEANYKMIAALAVMKKQLEKSQIMEFVKEHGMPGFAPTQGHIPSGVPFIGHAIDLMKSGELNNCQIVGKGSLFLGRMTNLFDGVSFLMERNSGQAETSAAYDETAVRQLLSDAMKDVAEKLTGA